MSRLSSTNSIGSARRSEEHTSELQSLRHLVCRLLLEKKKNVKATEFRVVSPDIHTAFLFTGFQRGGEFAHIDNYGFPVSVVHSLIFLKGTATTEVYTLPQPRALQL